MPLGYRIAAVPVPISVCVTGRAWDVKDQIDFSAPGKGFSPTRADQVMRRGNQL